MAIFVSNHATMSQEIKDHIERELTRWSADFVQQMVRTVRRKKIVGSGELLNSFKYEITQEANRQVIESLIAFKEEGRFVEMKSLTHDAWGRRAIDRLAAWVVDKGVERFRPGYIRKRKYAPKTPEALANSIAWGIFLNSRDGKRRRKTWYNKPKQALISNLYNEVAANIPTIVGDEIKKALKQ
jgi:hypothetical protein